MTEETVEHVVIEEVDVETRNKDGEFEQTMSRKKEKTEEEDMTVMLVDEPDRSINLGVVGVGQCGSKIAEQFYKHGYSAVAINSAMQDLRFIQIPENKKLFLDHTLGGAGKDLDTGREIVEQYAEEVLDHIDKNTEDCEVLMLVVGGGGGTGSGSAEVVANLMNRLGKPVVALYVLPMSSEDTLSKYNSIQTLSKLAKLASTDVISGLTVVDNGRIEAILPGRSLANFWKEANEVIVEPLDLFNKLSSQASEYISLDPTDFGTLLLGQDCSLYGMIEVKDYLENEEAIAEAIIDNLESGLLSSDFDLSEARNVGVIITGSKKALSETPNANLEYGFTVLNKICNDGTKVFRGIYEIPDHPDVLRIYSIFSGLGLPSDRVKELKAEAENHTKATQGKEDARATNMNIDLGKTKTTSAADAIYNKVKSKKSALGKLKRNAKKSVVDRRRR